MSKIGLPVGDVAFVPGAPGGQHQEHVVSLQKSSILLTVPRISLILFLKTYQPTESCRDN